MTITKSKESTKGLHDLFVSLGDLAGQLFHSGKPKEESISFSSLYEQVWAATWDMDKWYWLIDLYKEDSSDAIFAVFSCEGLLYKAEITVENSKISIGELVQVQEVFEPIKNGFLIENQKDGSSRWFLVSCSSVLNRSASIDSTQLFDNLIKRCEDSGKYPYLTYYHLGEPLKMGVTDWVARSDNLLMASGTFEKDNVIAECMKEAYEKDPSYWGASIAFWAIEGKMEQIAEGISVPMYTDGEFEEISILAEEHANCLFTSLYSNRKVTHMRDDLIEQISKLTGGNEELTSKIVSTVDSVNDTIKAEGLITREAPKVDPVTPNPEGSVETPAESTESVKTVEVDEGLVNDIVKQLVSHPSIAEALKPIATLAQSLEETKKSIETRLTSLEAQENEIKNSVEGRLQKLELDDQSKQEDWEKNLPRNVPTKVVYRAKGSSVPQTQSESSTSAAEIAAQTLADLGK